MKYQETNIVRGKEIVDLVFSLTGGRGFIAGGFARYCLSRNENPIVPGDIDVFCENEETYAAPPIGKL